LSQKTEVQGHIFSVGVSAASVQYAAAFAWRLTKMLYWERCYIKYGDKAAILTLAFPGLGQLHNKQFFKGIAIAGVFCILSLCYLWLAMIQIVGYQSSLVPPMGDLLLLMLITWEVSLFEAVFCAIKIRRRDAKRVNTKVSVLVSGLDVNNEKFEQVVTTRNLSKTGVCLAISREIQKGSLLSLEIESKPRCQGRVIWQRQTDCDDELLVGVEFLTPLTVL
jgi:PilZ domain